MAFLSFDKWLIQALQPDILPKYMLANQIAGIFLVAQTMVILAPSRVRLITQNPASIPILRFGSGIFCVLALLCGSAVWTLGIQTEALVYMPFFLIGILVLLTPYLERLYWISSDRVRFTTDLSFAMCFAAGAFVLSWIGYPPKPILILLLFVLLARFVFIVYLVQRYGRQTT